MYHSNVPILFINTAHLNLIRKYCIASNLCDLKFCDTVWHKFLTGENIDEFDEFPAIRQYFPYQNFPFS